MAKKAKASRYIAKPEKRQPKARKAGESASAIAQHEMPGWQPVPPSGPARSFGAAYTASADSAARSTTKVDAVMPSTEALHRKYFGAAGADVAAERAPTKVMRDDVEVVEMKSGDLRKSVGVNRRTKKVEWSQG
jgi:hypothetical protein